MQEKTRGKRLLSILLACFMMLSLVPAAAFATGTACVKDGADETKTYTSIAEAIAADTTDIVLTDNVGENVVIAEGKTITIDLNGFTLTNKDPGHTITVNVGGTLTIHDNSEGKTGKVQTNLQGLAALYNDGTAVVNGGLYTRNGVDTVDNMYYIIHNNGNMTINKGVTVEGNTANTGRHAAAVSNAWIDGVGEAPNAEAVATLTINGGHFIGGNATVKNNSQGEIAIYDGTFELGVSAIHNYNKVTIHGGVFKNTNGAVIFNQNDSTDRVATVDFYGGTIDSGTGNASRQAAFQSSAEKTMVNIHGGVVNGKLGPSGDLNADHYKVYGGLFTQSLPAQTYNFGGTVIEVGGSKYDNNITKIMADKDDNILVRYGDYYGVGMDTVNQCLTDSVTSGKTVDVYAQFGGSKTLNAPEGAKISNSDVNNNPLTVNGKTMAAGESHTVSFVAKIGEQKFTTFAEAVDAAQDGDEIVVLKDALIRETAAANGGKNAIEIAADRTITIDLNGFTLTKDGPMGDWGEVQTSAFINRGTLTIKDSSEAETGKMIGGGYEWCEGAVFKNYGTLNIQSGNFDTGAGTNGMGTSGHYLIYNEGTVNIAGGNFFSGSNGTALARNDNIMNISGGTFEQKDFVVLRNGTTTAKMTINGDVEVKGSGDRSVQAYGAVEISGGTFTGAIQIPEGGKLTMTGGTLNAGDDGKLIYDAGTGVVSGGTFSKEVPEQYRAPGYDSVTNADGTYGVSHTHKYDTETWEKDNTYHWHTCICGDKSDNAAHIPGAEATDTEPQTCTECGYELVAALGHENMIPTEAKAATCTEQGNNAYWTCSRCKKVYKDEAAGEETTVEAETLAIDPANHSGDTKTLKHDAHRHWHEWDCCHAVDGGVKADHAGGAATCQERAVCETCGEAYGMLGRHDFDTSTWGYRRADGHAHRCKTGGCTAHSMLIPHTSSGAATETTAEICTRCGYVIHDALGYTEGTEEQTGQLVACHNYEWVIDKHPTATETGLKHEECTICHDKKAPVEIPAIGAGLNQKVPLTGDDSNVFLWIAMLFASLGSIAAAVAYKKKAVKE